MHFYASRHVRIGTPGKLITIFSATAKTIYDHSSPKRADGHGYNGHTCLLPCWPSIHTLSTVEHKLIVTTCTFSLYVHGEVVTYSAVVVVKTSAEIEKQQPLTQAQKRALSFRLFT